MPLTIHYHPEMMSDAITGFPESVPAVNGTDGREAHSKFWIAAYSKPRSEKKTASELTKSGVETYVATQFQIRQWSDRKKKVEVVVIPSIVFAQIYEEQLNTILFHRNILKVITKPGEKKAAKIPSIQIDKLKYILGQSEIPAFFSPELFHIKQNVRLARGPLRGLYGEVVDVKTDSADIVILIDGLGGVKLTTNKADLEIIL